MRAPLLQHNSGYLKLTLLIRFTAPYHVLHNHSEIIVSEQKITLQLHLREAAGIHKNTECLKDVWSV